MHRLHLSRITGLIASAAVLGLLAGCATASRTSSGAAATPREWLAMTSPGSGGELSAGLAWGALASDPSAFPGSESAEPYVLRMVEGEEGHGFFHVVLLYIPNRIFDILDIVRARIRLGPGLAFDARATELADLFLGGYTSIFIGIPGPRREPVINWPFGIESKAGAELSVADASTDGSSGPHYGVAEFGIGAQFLLIGADIGVDPWEAVDFLVGLLTFDPVHDDL